LINEREFLDCDGRKRKSSFTLISATKAIYLGVNIFHWVRGVSLRCFSPSNCLKNIYKLRKIYDFRFLDNVFRFFKVTDRFIKVYMMFSRCFGSKIN
jgi:hypothetical protein